jgi:putative membrane-bound dehydrogenase-like protein
MTMTLLLLAAVLDTPGANTAAGLRAPEGFEVIEYAGSELANDIVRMTLDPKGRIVVSGRGYIKALVDDDGDGRADRAIDVADGPKDGAMGLLWEGSSLFVIGDGGLRRYRDADGDGNGRVDGPSELIRSLKTGGEHDAHALRRGLDGWLYVLCGNMTGIDASFVQTPASPIRDPVAGCVVRFSPDLTTSEVVADGFRNAYGMDFDADGELFTFDSDNERCVSLPWYEFTRFYHVIPGGHHGWLAPQRAEWWRSPPYFPDVVPPVATLGRGSPTGVACYRHAQFPAPYRGGFFLLDWTFGRVYFLPLERSGASYTGRPRVFLDAVGDNGFAPTDLVVHPDTGDLFISIGGRGTRGAVYRVRHLAGFQRRAGADIATPSRSLEWHPALHGALIEEATGADAPARLRALLGLARHRGHFRAEEVRGAVQANWDHDDRAIRRATALLIATLGGDDVRILDRAAQTPRERATLGLGLEKAGPADLIARGVGLLETPGADAESRLAGVRLIQRALGDMVAPSLRGTVWEGYSPRRDRLPGPDVLAPAAQAMRRAFPAGPTVLDREIGRTLAMIEDDDPASPSKVAGRLTDASPAVEDIHSLIVLARLRGPRGAEVTAQATRALLALDAKLARERLNRDRHWPLRVTEMVVELARKDPGLKDALLSDREFGRPDHALFARIPGFDRTRAAEVFLARAEAVAEYPWTADVVELIGLLPASRSLPALRRAWDSGGLEETILPMLAREPRAEDREKFLAGLRSLQPGIVRLGVEALAALPPGDEGEELLALIGALGRLPEGPEQAALRDRIVAALRRRTGQAPGTDRRAWAEWLTTSHPDLAARLAGADGVDLASWKARLAALDWSRGDAGRGRVVFTRVGCAACHSGAQALGPDLRGVTGRFSRADLFTAVLQPSRDISPRYRTTLVATHAGDVYQGLVIYEAVDSLILQTGAVTTVRLDGQQVAARRPTDVSLMPPGLLDKLTDGEVADLYAYLRVLEDVQPGRR